MKEWFYNDLSKEQSYSALVDKPPGTFLVRISANPMHIAVISMVYENFGVIHILVEYDAARGFFLQVRAVRRVCVCLFVCCLLCVLGVCVAHAHLFASGD